MKDSDKTRSTRKRLKTQNVSNMQSENVLADYAALSSILPQTVAKSSLPKNRSAAKTASAQSVNLPTKSVNPQPEPVNPPAQSVKLAGGRVIKYMTYPKYKQSGVEWLGEAPEHWELKKIRYLAILKSGENITSDHLEDEGEFPVFGGNGLRGYSSRYTHQGHYVLIGRQGALCGNINYATGKFWASEHAIVVSPLTEFATVWLGELLRSMNLNQYSISAAQPGLSVEMISGLKIPVPPASEQRAIAAFLNQETAKIDALVAKKRRLIKLLKEKRTALISHAVTKGLNPDAPMKSSGIDWLGEVPAHWEIPPLYARYIVQLGKMLDEKQITGEHLVPYLRNIDVRWDYVNVNDLSEMDIDPTQYERFTLKPGDMLVCEGGEVGRTGFWRGELPLCGFPKAIHRLRARNCEYDLPRFLYYVMYAAAKVGVFIAEGNPNTIPHLTGEKLRVYRFAFPPKSEQEAIVEHLDHETSKIDRLVEKIEMATTKLHEYRSALISAAVTGKIDVRHLAKETKPI